MKILYGVQGTGNGHITRARAMNQHFKDYDVQVDFLFSGREQQRYFDMNEFGSHWRCCRGLSFAYRGGAIDVGKTLSTNSLKQLHRDVAQLDLSAYDLVLTDFEPISAHAARRQGVPCVGIGHQYAFMHKVPTAGAGLVAKSVLRHFAPANHYLGLHWHHFDAPILPPIAQVEPPAATTDDNKIVVYLGFEDAQDVIDLLEPLGDHLFVVYGPYAQYQSLGNIQLKPLSREGFCRDLSDCHGVIANAGFGLASEAMQLGKKLLVKPLRGQMEQLSNARALVELQLGMAMHSLDREVVQKWLAAPKAKQIIYPDVANAVVRWLSTGNWHHSQTLANNLWASTRIVDTDSARGRTLNYAPAA